MSLNLAPPKPSSPYIGEIVHFWDGVSDQARAAMVVGLYDEDQSVDLCVWYPRSAGTQGMIRVPRDLGSRSPYRWSPIEGGE